MLLVSIFQGRKMRVHITLIVLILATFNSNAETTWRGLTVEPEYRCSSYDKSEQYPYPQSVEDGIVANMGGIVYGPYTGRYFDNDRETDIEHIVAASEGHDSGLCDAPVNKRIQFATDQLNLTLASPEVNRCGDGGKCGLDAAEWMPQKNKCWFANRVLLIKTKYDLSVDQAEASALETVLSSCESVELIFYPAISFSSDEEAPPNLDALELYDSNRNGRITCSEARAHGIAPVKSSHPAYEHMSDGDGDGVVCE
ncbi:MAG: excalibur calcium-binding domain-containing protein [Flavobacteriaceae bacterium]|nr:excalibur calcium-binding domain-containing protein [Flavobacteriaceae bacterium]